MSKNKANVRVRRIILLFGEMMRARRGLKASKKTKENKYPKTDHIKKINKICAKFV